MRKGQRQLLKAMVLVELGIGLGGCHIEVVDVDDWEDGDRHEASAVTSRTLEVQGQTGLRVVGLNGTIEIVGTQGVDEVSVYAVKRVRSRSLADAEEHLCLLNVSVRAEATEFVVETQQPQGSGGRDYLVEYRIAVPRDFAVRATNANGSVQVENLGADAWVENLNGDVRMVKHWGSSWITVGNGEIDASVELPDGGQIVHTVGNGRIRLEVQRQVSAQFGAQVGNGSITYSGLGFTTITSGPNVLQGRLGTGAGIIDLTVGNGWIQVHGS